MRPKHTQTESYLFPSVSSATDESSQINNGRILPWAALNYRPRNARSLTLRVLASLLCISSAEVLGPVTANDSEPISSATHPITTLWSQLINAGQ